MKRVTLGLCLAAALAACDDATRTSEPSAAPPAVPVAAALQQFTVRNLGTLGGSQSSAAGINEAGEVVGNSEVPSGKTRAFLWRPGHAMRSLGTLGGANSRARGINDRTEVVVPRWLRAAMWVRAIAPGAYAAGAARWG